jgi:hypothetical protein
MCTVQNVESYIQNIRIFGDFLEKVTNLKSKGNKTSEASELCDFADISCSYKKRNAVKEIVPQFIPPTPSS